MLMYQDGCTALLWATLHDRAAMVTLLLDKGASIDNASKVLLLRNLKNYVEYDTFLRKERRKGGREGHMECA